MALNHQDWRGVQDIRFGYGRHYHGYRDHAPRNTRFNPHASVSVYMGVPIGNAGFFDGQHRVLHTMWETTELPNSFVRYLPFYDQIIVPCEHNRQVFAKHHPNVVAVPEGVDIELFTPQPAPNNTRFQFRAGGSLWQRKGLDLLVTAFNQLALPDADLRIKAAPHAADVPQSNLGDNIFLDRQWMSEPEQVAWFADADCFVAPSRGEGWGLMPMQAIAMGIPTILSDSSGHREFLSHATLSVKTRQVKAPTGGLWDEVSVADLVETMLYAYQNRHFVKEQAMTNVAQMEQFTWWEASQKLVDALPHGTILKNPVWNPFFAQFGAEALRDIRADIGTLTIRHKKGEQFMLPDGPYQVLFDAGAIKAVPNLMV